MRKIVISGGCVTAFVDEISVPNISLDSPLTKRVSNIYPQNKFLRLFFVFVRALVDNKSSVANWTREWDVVWEVYIDSEAYGTFTDRGEAIAHEKKIYWEKNSPKEVV